MDDFALHEALIGEPGSRARLNTPVLVVDRTALAANIAAMAKLAKAAGLALRPHAKTHKCATIARLQRDAGAVGVCCAKLGEAEALAAGGVDDILVTSPIVTPAGIARAVALNARITLEVVADHPSVVQALAAAASRQRPLAVLVDVDPGIRRTGAASPQAAVTLARAIAEAPSLRFAGVQFYCGAHQHIAGLDSRRAALTERTACLRTVLDALDQAGLPAPKVTGGGTGTAAIDAELQTLTELQAGSYVFMDAQYDACEFAGPAFATALTIEATVISANHKGMVTIDAGLKAMATDAGPAQTLSPAGAAFHFMGDEHAALIAEGLSVGDRVRLKAPHCDPTVNLYDWLHVVEDDVLVALWPIDARGRSR